MAADKASGRNGKLADALKQNLKRRKESARAAGAAEKDPAPAGEGPGNGDGPGPGDRIAPPANAARQSEKRLKA